MRARTTVKHYTSHTEVANELRQTRHSVLRKMPAHTQPGDMLRAVKDLFYTLFPNRKMKEILVQKDFAKNHIYRAFSVVQDDHVAEVIAHVVSSQDLHVSFFYNISSAVVKPPSDSTSLF